MRAWRPAPQAFCLKSEASGWMPESGGQGPERSEGASVRVSTTAVLPKTGADGSTPAAFTIRQAEPYCLAP